MKVTIVGRGCVGLALAPIPNSAGGEVRFGVHDPSDPKHAADVEVMARLWIAQASVHGMALDTGWALARPA